MKRVGLSCYRLYCSAFKCLLPGYKHFPQLMVAVSGFGQSPESSEDLFLSWHFKQDVLFPILKFLYRKCVHNSPFSNLFLQQCVILVYSFSDSPSFKFFHNH